MKTQTKLLIITALMAVFFLIFPLLDAGYIGVSWADKLQSAIIVAALGFSFSLAVEKEEDL